MQGAGKNNNSKTLTRHKKIQELILFEATSSLKILNNI